MEDGSQKKIANLRSVAGARAITVKGTFRKKQVNILVDTGCNIVCISSRLVLRSEWKMRRDLKVRGFNGRIVPCPGKAAITWKMRQIKIT